MMRRRRPPECELGIGLTGRADSSPGPSASGWRCDLATRSPEVSVSTNYSLVGQRVRVHLYTREGRLLGAIEGRAADVSPGVVVGNDASGTEIRKDLVYVVDIEPGRDADGDPVPYENSAGGEGEGWFAVQDVTVVTGDGPPTFAN